MGNRREHLEVIETAKARMVDIREKYAELHLDQLENDQFNWQKAPDKWSVGQVMDHIIMTNNHYMPSLKQTIQGPPDQNIPPSYKQGLIGGRIARAMPKFVGNTITNRMKTFKGVDPLRNGTSPASYDHSILRDFENQLEELQEVVDNAEHYNLNGHKIKSLLGAAVKVKLGDALLLLTGHIQRHFAQIREVKEHPNFPAREVKSV